MSVDQKPFAGNGLADLSVMKGSFQAGFEQTLKRLDLINANLKQFLLPNVWRDPTARRITSSAINFSFGGAGAAGNPIKIVSENDKILWVKIRNVGTNDFWVAIDGGGQTAAELLGGVPGGPNGSAKGESVVLASSCDIWLVPVTAGQVCYPNYSIGWSR